MMDWLENISGDFKDWITAHGSNPFLWVVIFLVGLIIFAITYNALTKHHLFIQNIKNVIM